MSDSSEDPCAAEFRTTRSWNPREIGIARLVAGLALCGLFPADVLAQQAPSPLQPPTPQPTIIAPLPGQEPPPGLPVAARPRPDYDPIGIKWGSFIAVPQLTVSQSYDDNIFAFHTKTADAVSLIAPRFDLNSLWSRHAVGLSVSGGISRYASHSTEDLDAMRLDAFGRVDVDKDASVTFQVRHRRDADARSSAESLLNQTQRATYDEDAGRLIYIQRFNRLEFTTSFEEDQYGYDQAVNRDQDHSDHIATERAAYYFSPRVNAYLQASYDATRYDQNASTRDYDTLTMLVGSAFDIDTIFVGDLGVGFLRETQTNAAFPTVDSPAARARLIWNVQPITSLIATAEHTHEPTRLQGAFGRQRTFASMEAQHELQHDVLLRAIYGFEVNTYQGIVLTQQTHEAKLDGRYFLNRHFYLDASYIFRRRDASGQTSNLFNVGSFTENVVSLSLTARF